MAVGPGMFVEVKAAAIEAFCIFVLPSNGGLVSWVWDSPKCLVLESPRAHLDVVGMLRLYVWRKSTELAHSFLFCSCVYFCLYGPFNCISFHQFSRQLSFFWLCSSGLISALLVLSTLCLFMKVSFSPDIIPSGWLGSKHQLTKFRTLVLEDPIWRTRLTGQLSICSFVTLCNSSRVAFSSDTV